MAVRPLLQQNSRFRDKGFGRGKAICFGFKVWDLTIQPGHVSQFDPYPGAKGRQTEVQGFDTASGAGGGWSLCKLQRNDSRHLRFGNLFTSLPLVDCPTKKGTYRLTGTIHVNRCEDTPLMPVNTVPNMACADPGQFKQRNHGQKPRERGERSHSLDRILKWSCISQLYYYLGQPYS